MSTATKLALYIADDLEKLNTRVSENLSVEKLKLSTCTQISHMMESTWTEAKKAETNLDEERAYILYMRLFASLTALRQAKDAATNQVNPRSSSKNSLSKLFFPQVHSAILPERRGDLGGEGGSFVRKSQREVS